MDLMWWSCRGGGAARGRGRRGRLRAAAACDHGETAMRQGWQASGATWYPTAGVPGWACGHARNSQPPLARGKPGIDVAFPLLSFGAHPDCQNHTVPTAPAVRAPARPVGSSEG
jgi:hypothetical protein